MGQRLSTVQALDSRWLMGPDIGGSERKRGCPRRRSNDRLNHHPGPPSGSRRERGTQKEGFGRSKGGFTTKVHLIVNAEGLPMRAEITGGEVSDYKGFDTLLDDGLPQAKVFIADKGYDSDGIRESLEARGATPVIPGRANRRQPIAIDTFIYALRNRIER